MPRTGRECSMSLNGSCVAGGAAADGSRAERGPQRCGGCGHEGGHGRRARAASPARGRQRPSGRRGDGAPLGGLPGGPHAADLLIRAGANVKAATRDGATPLSLASTTGDAAMIAALIKAGADPNEPLPTGKTNLMLAARNGNLDALKALLDGGANINAKETLRGTTALMWAADEGSRAPCSPDRARSGHQGPLESAPRGRGPALGKAGDPRRRWRPRERRWRRERSPDVNALAGAASQRRHRARRPAVHRSARRRRRCTPMRCRATPTTT